MRRPSRCGSICKSYPTKIKMARFALRGSPRQVGCSAKLWCRKCARKRVRVVPGPRLLPEPWQCLRVAEVKSQGDDGIGGAVLGAVCQTPVESVLWNSKALVTSPWRHPCRRCAAAMPATKKRGWQILIILISISLNDALLARVQTLLQRRGNVLSCSRER